VLLVPATYALGRQLYGARAAAVSATLVAVSSVLVEYSTNSRGYTLQALCFVLMLTLVLVASRLGSRAALLGAVLVAAIGAYALPTMLYGILIAAAWLIAERPRPSSSSVIRPEHLAASGVLLGLIVLLLYLPVVLISGPDRLMANRFVVPLDGPELVRELPHSLEQTWVLWNRDVPWAAAALLLGGFVAISLVEVRRRQIPLGLFAAAVCLVMAVLQRVAPFERVWLFLLPLYFVVASGGLARLVDGRLLGVGFAAILGFMTLSSGSILASTETGAFPDAEAIAFSLRGRLGADDAVVTMVPASLPELQYYFPRAGLGIDSLVRSPQQARRVFVVAALDADPTATAGSGRPEEIARFRGSKLLLL
jgi:MFS family permease